MLPLQVLTVVLPAMSSKKEEREENRAAAAASICPGWIVQSLGSWTPRQNKPELKHLRAEAMKRNKNMKELRTAQEYVTWLSRNGPTESTAASHKTMLLQVDPEGMVDPEILTTLKCTRKSRTGVWGVAHHAAASVLKKALREVHRSSYATHCVFCRRFYVSSRGRGRILQLRLARLAPRPKAQEQRRRRRRRQRRRRGGRRPSAPVAGNPDSPPPRDAVFAPLSGGG